MTLISLLLSACGSDGGKFSLDGRLRNMNQGEFWVYSLDGGMEGIDTITVRSGRFSYELNLTEEATLVMVFPNYSEQPVFAKPGESVSIKGDATHLKEIIIQGTSENEEMTSLRMELNDLTPPDIPHAVSAFIEEHPKSLVSIYLLNRYFLQTPEPDYKQALKLTKLMLKEMPENRQLQTLSRILPKQATIKTGSQLPKFSALTIDGTKVTEAELKKELNVLSVWASWSYLSTNAQSRLKVLKKRHGDRLGIVSICLDGRTSDCRKNITRDSLQWQTVCDGKMWETPLLATFGMNNVPDNMLIDSKGRIIARSLTITQLEDQINNTLK